MFIKLSFAVLVVLVLSMTACSKANNEADFTVEPTADGKGQIITGYIGTETAVRIPAKIQGKPVREIGNNAFFNNFTVISVDIPKGVTKIGARAFGNSSQENKTKSKLTAVAIPKGVVEIGNQAFIYSPITAVSLPQSLTKLGFNAFAVTDISEIVLPASITDFTETKAVFMNCEKLEKAVLPKGMTIIPEAMFAGCSSLAAITLPASIKVIGPVAFMSCLSLTTITIPDSVETIQFGVEVFNSTPNLSNETKEALRKRGYTEDFYESSEQ